MDMERKNENCGYADVASFDDKLGVDKYYKGFTNFIRQCQTPMTLSIEGDWGTGKTTALNLIEQELKKPTGNQVCHVIWFNTWQYSSMGMDNQLTLLLMNSLHKKLQEIDTSKDKEVSKKAPFILRGVREVGTLVTDVVAGGAAAEKVKDMANVLFDLDQVYSMAESVERAKANVQEMIHKLAGEKDMRFVIFVDDLDRLEPRVAVELLEGIKNFMDCEMCVFVLAVDSSVIYDGIRSKYGDNIGEQKAKRFFDKIIQVPFSIPVNQYDIKSYLKQFLGEVEPQELVKYENAIRLILKNNPRSIKRAFNLLQLHELILTDIIKTEKDRRNLFVILLTQISDYSKYELLVNLVKMTSSDANEKLRDDEYEFVRELLELPDLDVAEESAEMAEREEQWTDFIRLLSEVMKVSSGGRKAEGVGDKAVAESQDELDKLLQKGTLRAVVQQLKEKYAYNKIGGHALDFFREDKRICSFKLCKEKNAVNIVIYAMESDEWKRPDIEGVRDFAGDKKDIKIGYYFAKTHITLVRIGEKSDEELLKEIFQFYEVL